MLLTLVMAIVAKMMTTEERFTKEEKSEQSDKTYYNFTNQKMCHRARLSLLGKVASLEVVNKQAPSVDSAKEF